MPTEAPTHLAPVAAMPSRAAIAQLTLRLRTALQEADAAEAEEAAIDEGAALAELRARLTPLLEERRRELDQELADVRAETAAAIAAARAETAAVVHMPETYTTDVVTMMPAVWSQPAATTAADELGFAVPALQPINIVIDAEAFGRVIATVLAEQLAVWGVTGVANQNPPPPVAVPKRSFWSQARHVDVLLMGLATIIVLVILASWMG